MLHKRKKLQQESANEKKQKNEQRRNAKTQISDHLLQNLYRILLRFRLSWNTNSFALTYLY